MPVRVFGGARPRVAGGQFGLQRIGAARSAQRIRARQRRQPAADQQGIPAAAVLVHQQDRPALRIGARMQPGSLQLHQGGQPMHLGLCRGQLGQDAAQAQGFIA
ncbi:hypothetical protein D3C72_1904190 [compost metagenome]